VARLHRKQLFGRMDRAVREQATNRACDVRVVLPLFGARFTVGCLIQHSTIDRRERGKFPNGMLLSQ
jgi:hypothetical protein